VNEDNRHVMHVAKVVQLRGEVDVAGDQDDGGGGRVGVGEPPQALTELVVGRVLRHRIDMDQSHLYTHIGNSVVLQGMHGMLDTTYTHTTYMKNQCIQQSQCIQMNVKNT
jgi:hypothetical protein